MSAVWLVAPHGETDPRAGTMIGWLERRTVGKDTTGGGVVLDTDDVATLTRFYADLRGWRIHHLDESDGSLDAGEGVAYLNIQHNPHYRRPVWPARPGDQQMMLHLDFEVTDLLGEVERAVGLGAHLAEYQPQDNVRVLLDPSGHPFCRYASVQ